MNIWNNPDWTPTVYFAFAAYWWIVGILVGIGIGRWIQRKIDRRGP